jgi:hypothetical protein
MTDAPRQPMLERLDVLVGDWRMVASVEGRPTAQARTTFEWIDGGAFLRQYAEAEPADFEPLPEWVTNSPLPTTSIVGLDDTAGEYTMLYSDARGVYRVYRMTLADGVLTIWRDAPGFFQRLTATFSDGGATFTGRWDRSPEGATWVTDFDFVYTRIG